jgi:hypothetical protein
MQTRKYHPKGNITQYIVVVVKQFHYVQNIGNSLVKASDHPDGHVRGP